jgi:hypothetical protein
VALAIAAQLSPFASQRVQAYVYVVVLSVPLHVPWLAVSVEPSWAAPEIVGVAVFVGAAWVAALPVSGLPNTAPIAVAATASPTEASQRFLSDWSTVIYPSWAMYRIAIRDIPSGVSGG